MSSEFTLGGVPSTIRGSARVWSGFSTSASTASGDIKAVDAGEFVGDEGETFRGKVNNDLPPHLDTTSEAWGIVSSALTTYADKLEGFQERLAGLKTQYDNQVQTASQAQTQVDGAEQSDRDERSRVRTARLELDPGQTLPASTYVSQTSGARTALTEANGAVEDTLQAARNVKSEHRTAVDTCCREIDRAKDMRFEKPPGFWGKLKNSVCDWIADHADLLKKISGVLKVISAIAGVLSFIPGLNVIMGPLALITGGLALGIDVSLKLATGEGSWLGIGIDAVTMVLPGAGKLLGKGLKGAVGAERVAGMTAKGKNAFNASKAGKTLSAARNSKGYKGLLKANDAVYSAVNKVPGLGALNRRAAAKAIAKTRAKGNGVDTAQAIVNRHPDIIARTKANPTVKRPDPRTSTKAQVAAMNGRTPNGDIRCVETGKVMPPKMDGSNQVRVDPMTGKPSATGQTMPITKPGDPNAMSIGHKPGHDYSSSQVIHTYDDAARADVLNDYNNLSHYHGYENAAHNSSKAGDSHLSNYTDNRVPVWDTTSPAHAAGGLIRLGND